MKTATTARGAPAHWIRAFEKQLIGAAQRFWRRLEVNEVEREEIQFWLYSCCQPTNSVVSRFLDGGKVRTAQREFVTNWVKVEDALTDLMFSLKAARSESLPTFLRKRATLFLSLARIPIPHQKFVILIMESPEDIKEIVRGMKIALQPEMLRVKTPRRDGKFRLMPVVGVLLPFTHRATGYRDMALLINAAQRASSQSAKDVTAGALQKAVLRNWRHWPLFFPNGLVFRSDT